MCVSNYSGQSAKQSPGFGERPNTYLRRFHDSFQRSVQKLGTARAPEPVLKHRERPHHVREVHAVEIFHELKRETLQNLNPRVVRHFRFIFETSIDLRQLRQPVPRRGDVHGVHAAPLGGDHGQQRVGWKKIR
jgi:hypothetical protein